MKRILAALLGLLLFASLASADTLFPNAPTDGQVYNFNNTGVLYQYSSAKGAWGTTGTTSPAITRQIFTASGTYTPSSGMQYAIIQCLGAGGGGGGAKAAASSAAMAGSGGAGSLSTTYATAGSVGASQAITIGTGGGGGSGATPANGSPGGDTSVGSLCVGKGGSGGGGITAGTAGAGGGAGGIAGTGDITATGAPGAAGGGQNTLGLIFANSGGGSTIYGGGGTQAMNSTGGNGTGYGSGGGGGAVFSTPTNYNGGSGANGIVIITEYLASSWGGPLPQVVLPGGRLTTASATPVPTTDQTAITTIYYTPYTGTFTPLWNGTQFTPVYTAELSAAMGSNWAANSNYDWFEYNDAGTLRLCSGPAWTSDTARGTGAGTTQLTLTQGILVNTVSMTCRYSNAATVTVAAGYGTYLGTMRTTGSTGTTQIKFGTNAASGGEAWVGLCNYYNRVMGSFDAVDSTGSYTYSGTQRAAHGSTTNRVSLISCMNEDGVSATRTTFQLATDNQANSSSINIGLDSTSVAATQSAGAAYNGSITGGAAGVAHFEGLVGLGWHFIQALESHPSTTGTFVGPQSMAAFVRW